MDAAVAAEPAPQPAAASATAAKSKAGTVSLDLSTYEAKKIEAEF